MSVVQKAYDVWLNKDLKTFNEIYSDDYVCVQHSTGFLVVDGRVKK